MKKSIFSKPNKKNWILIITLFLIGLLIYNKTRVLAEDIAEPRTIICEQGEVEPQCTSAAPYVSPEQVCRAAGKILCNQCDGCLPNEVCCCDIKENKLEIPIGRAVDQAEYLAEQIIAELGILIENAGQESAKAREMPGLAGQCDISNCQPKCEASAPVPSGCTPGYTCTYQGYNHTGQEIIDGGFSRQDCNNLPNDLSIDPNAIYAIFQYSNTTSGWCNIKVTTTSTPGSCQGDACPFSEIHAVQNEINSLAQAIRQSQQKISDLNGQMAEAFEKLQKSRTRLADCVVRPYKLEAFERGEVTGKFFVSCQGILDGGIPIHSYLGNNLEKLQEGCYGNVYCQALDEEGKPLPFPPGPCAEDFYCCY